MPEDNASVLDAIRVADEEIKNKVEKFPVEKCKSARGKLRVDHHNQTGKLVTWGCLLFQRTVSVLGKRGLHYSKEQDYGRKLHEFYERTARASQKSSAL